MKQINLYSKAVDIHNNYISKTDDSTECKLIDSLLHDSNYRKRIQDNLFYKYLNDITSIDTKEKLDILLETIKLETDDISQLNTAIRLINIRALKHDDSIDTLQFITKSCPHCGTNKTCTSDTYYTICGYSKKGFDWKGCGKDWCFSCSKKLCKTWSCNHLYNTINRKHNDTCCKNKSFILGDDYLEDYCQCNIKNVKR